jgi:hypothetical protein
MHLDLGRLGRNYDFPDEGIAQLLVFSHIDSKGDVVGGAEPEQARQS